MENTNQSKRVNSYDIYPSAINYHNKKYDNIPIPKKYDDFFKNFDFEKEIRILSNTFHINNIEIVKDVLQDSLIKLILHLKKGTFNENKSNIHTYLFMIFKHIYVDYKRKTHRKGNRISSITHKDNNTLDIFQYIKDIKTKTPEAILIAFEVESKREELITLLFGIPKGNKKETIKKFYLNEMSINQIEQERIETFSTIRVHLHRGRNEIKKYLDKNKIIKDNILETFMY